MQLALTKTMGIQKRLSRELDDTRIELENTRHELAKTRTYIEVQNEEQAELIQLVDELDNTLEDKDETIDNLTHAVKEIKSKQIGLYYPDNDYNHQEYHSPHYDMYHHGPMAFPYYSNYHQGDKHQTSSPELHQPSPNHRFQEYYPILPHSPVVQPDYYTSPSVISDQSLGISPQECSPLESIIHDSSCLTQPDAIADSHPEKRLQDYQTPPHSSPSNITVDSAVVTPGAFDELKAREEIPRDSINYTMNPPLEPSSHSLAKTDSHPEKRSQDDHPPPNPHSSPSNVTVYSLHSENTKNDVSCPAQMAQATAASPKNCMQSDSVQLLDQSPPTGIITKDSPCHAQPDATATQKRLHDAQPPDHNLIPSTAMLERMKNDIQHFRLLGSSSYSRFFQEAFV